MDVENAELDAENQGVNVTAFHALHSDAIAQGAGEPASKLASASSFIVRDQRWGCCKADIAENLDGSQMPVPMESLSYTPFRFDDGPTIDVERSHARYSKIVVHSARARTQRRSKVWEDWIRSATLGRSITMCCGLDEAASECSALALERIPATYFLDRGLTKLAIQPACGIDMSPINIMIDNIQVICPATEFMLFLDQVEGKLNSSETACAVLLQYVTEDTERKRVCFLEESEGAKNSFVQALTSLWLEKRNDHSMWF